MTKIIPLLCFLFIFDKMPFVAKKSQRFHNSSISFCRSRKRQTGFLEPAAQLNEVMLNADKEKQPIKKRLRPVTGAGKSSVLYYVIIKSSSSGTALYPFPRFYGLHGAHQYT